jgi:hypothetical protein
VELLRSEAKTKSVPGCAKAVTQFAPILSDASSKQSSGQLQGKPKASVPAVASYDVELGIALRGCPGTYSPMDGAGSHWSAVARRGWPPSAYGMLFLGLSCDHIGAQCSAADLRYVIVDPKAVSHHSPQICSLPPPQNASFSMLPGISLLLYSSCSFVVCPTTKCDARLVSRLGHAWFMTWRSLVEASVKGRCSGRMEHA